MKMQHIHYEVAGAVDLAAVTSFYETVGYNRGVHPDDRIMVARLDKRIIGAVRLCEEAGALVLRGMYIADNLRGKGMGARLLEYVSAEIGSAECWCVPYVHLTEFYSRIGFEVWGAERSPKFLVERQAKFTNEGNVVTIMRRRMS